MGLVPLVAARGAGAEMRRTRGAAVFAGMLGVPLFGIFLTPVFYYVFRRLSGPFKPTPAPDLSTAERTRLICALRSETPRSITLQRAMSNGQLPSACRSSLSCRVRSGCLCRCRVNTMETLNALNQPAVRTNGQASPQPIFTAASNVWPLNSSSTFELCVVKPYHPRRPKISNVVQNRFNRELHTLNKVRDSPPHRCCVYHRSSWILSSNTGDATAARDRENAQ
jgi:hypothetical protein